MKSKISIVVPVYNSSLTLMSLFKEIYSEFINKNKDFEVIFVNDSSKDESLDVLNKIYSEYPDKTTVISLKKNYGQQNAILCGFRYCVYDLVVTMDDDLQNPVTEIFKMEERLNQGFDAVYGVAKHKQHNLYRNLGSKLTNSTFNVLVGKPKHIKIGSFRIIRKNIIDEIIKTDKNFIYISALLFKRTTNVTYIDVSHRRREVGKSNYNIRKLVRLYINLIIYYSRLNFDTYINKRPQYEIDFIKLRRKNS